MPLPISTIAYGSVVVAGVILFSIGIPNKDIRQTSTPSAAVAEKSEAAALPSGVSGGGTTLHSVSFDLPISDRTFPGGALANAINNNCLACHSAGMVLTQPATPRAAWQAKVHSMRYNYKAPVAETDVPAIVDYLVSMAKAKTNHLH